MTAYELADKLKRYGEVSSTNKVWQAVKMLRQQATELDKVIPQLVKANGIIENLRVRNAELEKLNAELKEYNTEMNVKEHDLEMKVYQLEKQSEPVAWMNEHGEIIENEHWAYPIPLYTTPQDQADRIAELEKQVVIWAKATMDTRIKLATTPQTKPLSDEEILEIKTLMEINYGCVPPLEFAWAIEAKVRGQ